MEAFARDLREMQRTPLTPEHVELIRGIGEQRHYRAGDTIAAGGDSVDEFIYCEEGEIEAVDPVTDESAFEFTLGPGQFLGEISFLNGGAWGISMRARRDTRCTVAPRPAMLDLMARVPEISDLIVTVYAARRRRVIDDGKSGLIVVGSELDPNLQSIVRFTARNKIPIREYEQESDVGRAALSSVGADVDRPALLFGRDVVLHEPTPRDVARLMGLDLPLGNQASFDVVIVGAGPAGIAAAVYAGAEGLSALVVEDQVIGGQAGTSSRIENYMGFPTGISGADLCFRGEVQAMRLGTRFVMPRRVVAIARDSNGYCITLDDGESVGAKAAIIATGVQYRRLPIPRLSDFEGRGVYYAATDAEARFCRGTEVVIIGGGNSAGQAAMFLSRYARHVHLLVRGESLATSMSAYLSNRLREDPAITLHFQTECVGLGGGEGLESIRIRDKAAGEERTIESKALFVMAGAIPKTDWLKDLVALDDKGFMLTGPQVGGRSTYETSAPGIFAVGDVRSGSVKRVASSVGEGSVVVSHVWQFVHEADRSA